MEGTSGFRMAGRLGEAVPLTGRRAGLVLLAGAAANSLLVGGAGVPFDATPLLVGVTAVLAGVIGRRWRLLPIGITLLGWGASVFLVGHGPLPQNRDAPAYLVGVGVGFLAAQLFARDRGLSMTGAATTAVSAGIAAYVAYDIEAFGDWPWWTAILAAWGVVEFVRPADDAEVPPARTVQRGRASG